jgi:hypothetical protein
MEQLNEDQVRKMRRARRMEIYKKNQEDHISYSRLAVEYGITASRVSRIIAKVRKELNKLAY